MRLRKTSSFVIVSTGYPHGLKQEIVLISYRKRGAYLKQHSLLAQQNKDKQDQDGIGYAQ